MKKSLIMFHVHEEENGFTAPAINPAMAKNSSEALNESIAQPDAQACCPFSIRISARRLARR